MAYIVDIIIIILLAASVYAGYKRGLVKTLFGCFSLVAAIVLASVFGQPVGNAIRSSNLFDGISEGVTNEISVQVDSLSGMVAPQKSEEFGISAALNEEETGVASGDGEKLIKDFGNTPLGSTLYRLGVDEEQLVNDFKTAWDESFGSLGNSVDLKGCVVELISGPVLDCIASALGTVIVFVLSLILLKIVCFFLDKVFKLPLLSTVNKYGGLCAGVLSGFIGVFVLCMIVETLLPVLPENPVLYTGMANDTVVYNLFVNLNPIISLLFG